MRLPRLFMLGCVMCTAVFLSGCNTTRYMANSMVPMTEKMNMAVNRNTDVDLVRDAMPAGIVQLEGLVEASPDNPDLLLQLSEAYYGYAYSFVEDVNKKRAAMLYKRSLHFALRILKKNKQFAAVVDGPSEKVEPVLKSFHKDDVPALYWASIAWMSWVGLNLDDPAVFPDLPKIEMLLKRCCELDETYYYGGAHACLGVMYASRSVVQGGDPALAKAQFDRAFAISKGRMLTFDLLYAKYYAYQIQDRDLYVRTLEKICATPAEILPEKAFANAVARQKAAVLLKNVDNVF